MLFFVWQADNRRNNKITKIWKGCRIVRQPFCFGKGENEEEDAEKMNLMVS